MAKAKANTNPIPLDSTRYDAALTTATERATSNLDSILCQRCGRPLATATNLARTLETGGIAFTASGTVFCGPAVGQCPGYGLPTMGQGIEAKIKHDETMKQIRKTYRQHNAPVLKTSGYTPVRGRPDTLIGPAGRTITGPAGAGPAATGPAVPTYINESDVNMADAVKVPSTLAGLLTSNGARPVVKVVGYVDKAGTVYVLDE